MGYGGCCGGSSGGGGGGVAYGLSGSCFTFVGVDILPGLGPGEGVPELKPTLGRTVVVHCGRWVDCATWRLGLQLDSFSVTGVLLLSKSLPQHRLPIFRSPCAVLRGSAYETLSSPRCVRWLLNRYTSSCSDAFLVYFLSEGHMSCVATAFAYYDEVEYRRGDQAKVKRIEGTDRLPKW